MTNTTFSFNTYAEAIAAEIVQAKRVLIGAVASIAAMALGATCGIVVAGYLGAAAMSFTGFAFIAILVEVFVLLLSWAVAAAAAHAVNEWVTTGNAGLWFNAVGAKVKRLFKRGEETTHIKQELNGSHDVKPRVRRARKDTAAVQS